MTVDHPAIVSLNLGNASAAAVRRDLDRLLATAHVAALQEAGDRWPVLHSFLSDQAGVWNIWAGEGAGARSVPMLYRADLGPMRLFSRLAVPRMTVGRGSGPDVAKAKYITGVGFDNLDVLNTHFVASASGPKAGLLRKAHYRRHAKVLARMMQNRINRGRQVLAVGDFNAPPTFELLDPLRAVMFPPTAALQQYVTIPTHGARIYDQGWSDKPGAVVVSNTSSDHHAVTITL